jgi:hypothetical protein
LLGESHTISVTERGGYVSKACAAICFLYVADNAPPRTPLKPSSPVIDFSDDLDEEFPLGDGTADMAGSVICPYCGEQNFIALDPGSGGRQDYVEDCQVCCQPWRVRVHYDAAGMATVRVDREMPE